MSDVMGGYVPVYAICAISDEDFAIAISRINGDFKGIKSPPLEQGRLISVNEVLDHSRGLDDELWNKKYIIVLDRTAWDIADGLLLLNTDFKGALDGMRAPPDMLGPSVLSMTVGTTDWGERICNSGRMPCVPSRHFALLSSDVITDPLSELESANLVMSAGYNGRKAKLWSLCQPIAETMPTTLEDAIEAFKVVRADRDVCHSFFIFLDEQIYEPINMRIVIANIDDKGLLIGHKEMEADEGGEFLNRIFVGIDSGRL